MDNQEIDRQKEWYNSKDKEVREKAKKIAEFAGKMAFATIATAVVAILGTLMFLIGYGAMSVMTDLSK